MKNTLRTRALGTALVTVTALWNGCAGPAPQHDQPAVAIDVAIHVATSENTPPMTPQAMESQMVTPLESQIHLLDGTTGIQTRIESDFAVLTINLKPDADIDAMTASIEQCIERATPTWPSDRSYDVTLAAASSSRSGR